MLLADIATGDTATGDVLFLIAAILFALAALGAWLRPTSPNASTLPPLVAAAVPVGLCLVAIGLMLQ